MSDKGDKSCPLCAEEMDLTSHVPYDKEKIVGMADNCGRVVADISTENKVKSQKTKAKPSEGRKQLSSVRIVQRNLVYVVDLPLNLGDEDLLQHREYFGRYGRVLKVSMSRTTTGVIQQFPNNTCSVYIIYSKEEEAACCIQAVHGFTLEDKPLRVQEITGATTNLQCRSGNMLPPPLDENGGNYTHSTGKPAVNASNLYPSLTSSVSTVRGSPPNSSSGRPAILPSGASWGMRASSSQPSIASAVTCDALDKKKENATGVPVPSSPALASTVHMTTLHGDIRKKLTITEGNQHSEVKEKLDSSRERLDGSDLVISSLAQSVKNDGRFHRPVTKDQVGITLSKSTDKLEDITLRGSYGPVPEKSAWDDDETDDNLSLSSDKNVSNVRYYAGHVSNLLPENLEKPLSSGEDLREMVTSGGGKQLTLPKSTAAEEQCEGASNMPLLASSTAYAEVDEDVRSFNRQRLQDSQVVTRPSYLSNLTAPLRVSNYASEPSIHKTDDLVSSNMNGKPIIAGGSAHGGSQVHACSAQVMLGLAHENGYLFPNGEGNQMKRFESHVDNGQFSATDSRENSIISDILSMDLESDGSLAARNLARLFSDVDEQHGSQMLSASWNAQSTNNQSRFSFARQEESGYQTYVESLNPGFRHPSFSHNIIDSRNQFIDKVGHNSSIGVNTFEAYKSVYRNQATISTDRFSASMASPVSAPPGFSVPNRIVPPSQLPVFTSFERADQTFNTQPGHTNNHSIFRSSSQSPPTGTVFSNGDIEFTDPAILAVGKGRFPVVGNNGNLDMRSEFPSELGAFGDLSY